MMRDTASKMKLEEALEINMTVVGQLIGKLWENIFLKFGKISVLSPLPFIDILVKRVRML